MGKKGGEGAKGLGLKKGPWTKAEDAILVAYVREHGEGNWNAVQKNSGLSRCGKSCRLRWANHLRPNLKKGSFSPDEELLILRLHAQLGNKWARMAAQLPGRTDNEIKNYWNTRIKKRLKAGLPLYPPEIQAVEGAQPTTTSSASSADAATPPFPLSAPIDFSPSITPLLTHDPFLSPTPHLKSFSLPYSAPVSPCSTASLFQYNLLNYELGSILYNPMLPETSPFSSAKTELPSTQLFSEPLGSGGDACGGQSGNSGLLDALLQESQSLRALLREKEPPPLPAEDEDAKIEPLEFDGSKDTEAPPQDTNPVLEPGNKWEEPSSSAGTQPKKEPMDEIVDPVREDISTLLDMIPTVPMSVGTLVPEWYNSDSGEISNGQSSGITSNDLGLGIPQLTSSLSVKPEDHDWTIGSCPWNNMPGIC